MLLDIVSSSDSSGDDEVINLLEVPLGHEFIKVHDKIRSSGVPNCDGVKYTLSSSSGLNYRNFKSKLVNYNDNEICKYIQYGWPIGHNGSITKCSAKQNHKGAREFPTEVSKYLHTEISLGRVIGPFNKNPYASNIAVSPLNSLEKRGTSDRRVITDLSFPELHSVNSGINKDVYLGQHIKTKYPTVDNIIELIIKKGEGCLLFKRDMRKAFRQIRVDPGDVHLLSFRWKGEIYSDTVLTMGLRSAAYICQRLTNSVAFICKSEGYEIINYLDDFCGVEKCETAEIAFRYLGDLLKFLGIEEAKNKVALPSTRVAFLGVWFDTVAMTMEVTPERLLEIKGLTESWLSKELVTVKEVQSIIGKLNFVAKCVKPARIFIGRMLNFLREMPRKGTTRLTEEFKGDILWWFTYLPNFNGVALINNNRWSLPDEVLASDACLSGCGAVCGQEFFHRDFPKFILDCMIHIKIGRAHV